MITDPLKAAAEAWSQIPRFKEIFGIAYKYGFTDFLKLVHALQKCQYKRTVEFMVHQNCQVPLCLKLQAALYVYRTIAFYMH